jgi:hypothetical protein
MPLNQQQIKEIRSLAESHRRAANSATETLATLWQTRLNMALALNDEELVRSAVRDAGKTSYMDTNCQCNCGGGPILT